MSKTKLIYFLSECLSLPIYRQTHHDIFIMALLDNDNKLTFGAKHKGDSIDDIIRNDIHYCLWLKEQAWVQKDEQLFDKIKDLKEPPICMPWGKHKGRTIADLSVNEREYLEWVKKSDFIQKNKKVYSEVCKYV